MKEFINFYYGIYVNNLKQINDYYLFEYQDNNYYLIPFNQDDNRLNSYINIANNLLKYNIKSHIIIRNNSGKLITFIDDVGYILLQIDSSNEEINIFDIRENQNKYLNEKVLINKNYLLWSDLWQSKTDFLENSLKEMKKDDIIDQTMDYYIGLCENAIMAFNQTIKLYFDDKYPLTWCHKRIYYPNMSVNYLNPINYILDYDIRDIAEYIKSCFFKDSKMAYNELESFIKIYKFNNYSANLFFIRLLYPSYYYDILEKWINNKIDSSSLINIIEKQDEYELFLKKTYQILSRYALMAHIDYLIL